MRENVLALARANAEIEDQRQKRSINRRKNCRKAIDREKACGFDDAAKEMFRQARLLEKAAVIITSNVKDEICEIFELLSEFGAYNLENYLAADSAVIAAYIQAKTKPS